ncbi:unnamed protein product [marine sediment metagenome]|uniref:Uncharacterized protein n=1 Tax=marine sediment metagenome TaxID=412755 RepID=X1C9U5_9ZZZZ
MKKKIKNNYNADYKKEAIFHSEFKECLKMTIPQYAFAFM